MPEHPDDPRKRNTLPVYWGPGVLSIHQPVLADAYT